MWLCTPINCSAWETEAGGLCNKGLYNEISSQIQEEASPFNLSLEHLLVTVSVAFLKAGQLETSISATLALTPSLSCKRDINNVTLLVSSFSVEL